VKCAGPSTSTATRLAAAAKGQQHKTHGSNSMLRWSAPALQPLFSLLSPSRLVAYPKQQPASSAAPTAAAASPCTHLPFHSTATSMLNSPSSVSTSCCTARPSRWPSTAATAACSLLGRQPGLRLLLNIHCRVAAAISLRGSEAGGATPVPENASCKQQHTRGCSSRR
jgi:hypothetical protein